MTSYGVVQKKTCQAFLYINDLLQDRALPDAQLFTMIMDKAPDKALTKISVKSLFNLARFLQKRAFKIGGFNEFLSFYQKMLKITQAPHWIQLMIELAKTKKEFLGKSLIDEYLAVCKTTAGPKNLRLVMHAVRMKLEAPQKRVSEEELSKMMGVLLED